MIDDDQRGISPSSRATANRGTGNRGTANRVAERDPIPRRPTWPAACLSRTIGARSFAEFQDKLKSWMARCVLSRTNEMHRERAIVDNNDSVLEVWSLISGGNPRVQGGTGLVFADPQWKLFRPKSGPPAWGVASVRFRTAVTEPAVTAVPPPYQDPFRDLPTKADWPDPGKQPLPPPRNVNEAVARLRAGLERWRVKNEVRRPKWGESVDCMLRGLAVGPPYFDDEYISGESFRTWENSVTMRFPSNDAEVSSVFTRRADRRLMDAERRAMSDEQRVRELQALYDDIDSGAAQILRAMEMAQSRRYTARGWYVLKDWIIARRSRTKLAGPTPASIYACFRRK